MQPSNAPPEPRRERSRPSSPVTHQEAADALKLRRRRLDPTNSDPAIAPLCPPRQPATGHPVTRVAPSQSATPDGSTNAARCAAEPTATAAPRFITMTDRRRGHRRTGPLPGVGTPIHSPSFTFRCIRKNASMSATICANQGNRFQQPCFPSLYTLTSVQTPASRSFRRAGSFRSG